MTAPYTANESTPATSAQARYAQLETERSGPLERARECSSLTIPSLIPPAGTTDATRLPQPYNSVGARGVNNLAAKLLLVLFPPGQPFFRLDVDESVLDTLKKNAAAQGQIDPQGAIDEGLSKVEKGLTKKLEEKNFRASAHEALKHLIVGGNGLLQLMKDGRVKFHPISRYVVKRELDGDPVEIVVCESVSRSALPADVLALSTQGGQQSQKSGETKGDSVEVFTWVRLIAPKNGGERQWISHQEIFGIKIPGSDGQWPVDAPAWLALRWEKVSGNDYGRGHVEQYLGDHWSLESLSKSIVEGTAGAAKLLWMVNEGGTTQRKVIAKAPNNAVVDGNAADVTVLKADKVADFTVAQNEISKIERRLEQAYLQTSSIQRNAERVTAEEIRLMAAELESAVGGTYSLLTGEWQRPLVLRLMAVMTKARLLPAFPKGVINPTIIAGLDGLGRSNELQRLDLLLAGAEQVLQPGSPISEYVNAGAYLKRRAAALTIDINGLVRSDQEVAQNRQAAAQSAITQKAAPALVKASSDQAVAAEQGNASAQ